MYLNTDLRHCKGEIDHADLLVSMDEQISRAKEEASSRKAIMEKVERWMLARDEERWLEEYSMVKLFHQLIYMISWLQAFIKSKYFFFFFSCVCF